MGDGRSVRATGILSESTTSERRHPPYIRHVYIARPGRSLSPLFTPYITKHHLQWAQYRNKRSSSLALVSPPHSHQRLTPPGIFGMSTALWMLKDGGYEVLILEKCDKVPAPDAASSGEWPLDSCSS